VAEASCNQTEAAMREAWLTNPSTNWSGDPDNPESLGLGIAKPCNTGLRYRDFSCNPDAIERNVHGFVFFIAEAIGFTTVICDEIDGIDTSKRLVEQPIRLAYQRGQFTSFMSEVLTEYSARMCRCGSKECATKVRDAYNELDQLSHLLSRDSPTDAEMREIAKSRQTYGRCQTRFYPNTPPRSSRGDRKQRVGKANQAPAPVVVTDKPGSEHRDSSRAADKSPIVDPFEETRPIVDPFPNPE
jgi:hypothetical protein